MLPKSARIPRELFKQLLQHSRYANSAHFTLRYRVSSGLPQIGVSVSKKVSKLAVVRNTVRRRAYSALYPSATSLPKGLYLLVAKPGAERIKGAPLKTELEELLNQAL